MAMLGKVDLEKLRLDVQVKFDKIREALNVREKLLLRQIDVIVSTTNGRQSSSTSETDEIKFITDNEENVLNSIRSFGKFNLDNINLALQDLYINEDYIAPAIDHETMYKCLSNSSDGSNGNDEESIVVDFSTNKKLIRDNVSNMNESIINITLSEAKELIRKSHKLSAADADETTPITPLNLHGIIDEDADDDDSMPAPMHSKSSQTVENKRKSRFKPKITINNCNGTINLKNISNLTINCATDDSFKAAEVDNSPNNNVEAPKSTTITTTTSTSSAESNQSNSSGNSASSSNAISPKQATDSHSNRHIQVEYDDDDRSATCEFYNRLLNEIKHSLKQKTPKVVSDSQQHRFVVGADEEDDEDYEREPDPGTNNSNTDDDNGNDTSGTSHSAAPNKKLILRNFENLKIILESNDNSDVMRPVQIEQWLAEIISETEIEPMQNTDILEHSKIYSETC